MSLLGGFKKLLGDAGNAVSQAVMPQQIRDAATQGQYKQLFGGGQDAQQAARGGVIGAADGGLPHAKQPMQYIGYDGKPLQNQNYVGILSGGSTQPTYDPTNGDQNPNAVMGSHYYQPTRNQPIQGYGQEDLSQGIQGGTINQGYIPLQGSESPLQQLLRRR